MPRNLTKDLRKKIINLYKSGYNITKIAKKLNHTRKTVRRWVNRESLDDRYRAPNPPIIGDDKLPKLIDIFKKNPYQSTRIAAEHFNCSIFTIKNTLRRAGIQFEILRQNNSRICPKNSKSHNMKTRGYKSEDCDASSSDCDVFLSSMVADKIEIEIDLKCPITDPLAFVSTEMILDEDSSNSCEDECILPDKCENIPKFNVKKARVKL